MSASCRAPTPWRQGLKLDAGLLVLRYQRDPRMGFVKIFDRMAKFDMLNLSADHLGGGLFACSGGATPETEQAHGLLAA